MGPMPKNYRCTVLIINAGRHRSVYIFHCPFYPSTLIRVCLVLQLMGKERPPKIHLQQIGINLILKVWNITGPIRPLETQSLSDWLTIPSYNSLLFTGSHLHLKIHKAMFETHNQEPCNLFYRTLHNTAQPIAHRQSAYLYVLLTLYYY